MKIADKPTQSFKSNQALLRSFPRLEQPNTNKMTQLDFVWYDRQTTKSVECCLELAIYTHPL